MTLGSRRNAEACPDKDKHGGTSTRMEVKSSLLFSIVQFVGPSLAK